MFEIIFKNLVEKHNVEERYTGEYTIYANGGSDGAIRSDAKIIFVDGVLKTVRFTKLEWNENDIKEFRLTCEEYDAELLKAHSFGIEESA